MQATVSHDGHSTTGSFIVVKSGTALLGLDLIAALHMHIEGTKVLSTTSSEGPPTVQTVSAAPCATAQAAPEITIQEIGCAKGFVHKIQLKRDAVPVQQKLRRLPFSVRQAVSDELKDLQEKGVIERIDASPWVSPIVVTQRKDGGKLRMCVDLREPNKAIVSDCYPLPHMDERSHSLLNHRSCLCLPSDVTASR